MARSAADGDLDLAPSKAVVDLDVTFSAALPDPRFRRLVGATGVGLNVNPTGVETFLWVKSADATTAGGGPAPPQDALGDVMLLNPDAEDVPAGYVLNTKSLTHGAPGLPRQCVAVGRLEDARKRLGRPSLHPVLRVALVAGPQPVEDLGDGESDSDSDAGAAEGLGADWIKHGCGPEARVEAAPVSLGGSDTPGCDPIWLYLVRGPVRAALAPAAAEAGTPAAGAASAASSTAAAALAVGGMANPALSSGPSKAGARWDVPEGAAEEAIVRVLAARGWRLGFRVVSSAGASAGSAADPDDVAVAATLIRCSASREDRPLTAEEADASAASLAAVRAVAYRRWAHRRRAAREDALETRAAAETADAIAAAEAKEAGRAKPPKPAAPGVTVPPPPPPPPHLGPYFGAAGSRRRVVAAVYAQASEPGAPGPAAVSEAMDAVAAVAGSAPATAPAASPEEEWRSFLVSGLPSFLRKCLRCKPSSAAAAPLVAALCVACARWVGEALASDGASLPDAVRDANDDTTGACPVPAELLSLLGLATGGDGSARAFFDAYGRDLDAPGASPAAHPRHGASPAGAFNAAPLALAALGAADELGSRSPDGSGYRPVVPDADAASDIARMPGRTYASAYRSSLPSAFQVGALNALAASGGVRAMTRTLRRTFTDARLRSSRHADVRAAAESVAAAAAAASSKRRAGGGRSYASAAVRSGAPADAVLDPVSQRPGEEGGATGAGPLRADRGWRYGDERPVSLRAASLMLRALLPLKGTPKMSAPRFGETVAPGLLRALLARLARPSDDDLASLAAGARDEALQLLEDATLLARTVTDSKRFGPAVAGTSAAHTADRIRDGALLALGVTCLRRADDAAAEMAAGTGPPPPFAPAALAAAGASLLADVVASARGCQDVSLRSAGFVRPAASGAGRRPGARASMGSTTVNPMHAARAAAATAATNEFFGNDEDDGAAGAAGGRSGSGALDDPLSDANINSLEALRAAWPRRRLAPKWATASWLAAQLHAEGIPALLAAAPPSGAASPLWLETSAARLALGAECVAFIGAAGGGSVDDAAALLAEAALSQLEGEPAASSRRQMAACQALATVARFSSTEQLWDFWQRVETMEPSQVTPPVVRLVAEMTVQSAEAVRARDRRPPFASRFAVEDARTPEAAQYQFGAPLLLELGTGAAGAGGGSAADPASAALARQLLPALLGNSLCKAWLPSYVTRAVSALVDAADRSATEAGVAIDTAKRLLSALPARGSKASQQSALAELSSRLGGGGVLTGLLLDELEQHRRSVLAALGWVTTDEDAVTLPYAEEEAAAADGGAPAADDGDGDDGAAPDRWAVSPDAVMAAQTAAGPGVDLASTTHSAGEPLSAALRSRLDFLWFVLGASKQTLALPDLARLWRVCVRGAVGPSDARALLNAIRSGVPLREQQWQASAAGTFRVVVLATEAAAAALRLLVAPAASTPGGTLPSWLRADSPLAAPYALAALPAAGLCLADLSSFVAFRCGALDLDRTNRGLSPSVAFWLREPPSSLPAAAELWAAFVDATELADAAAAGSAAAEGALYTGRRLLVALHTRVQRTRLVPPSRAWAEFAARCLVRVGRAAGVHERLAAADAGGAVVEASTAARTALEEEATRSAPALRSSLWLLLLLFRRLVAGGPVVLSPGPGKKASAAKGKGKGKGRGKGTAARSSAAKPPSTAAPSLPAGDLPSRLAGWAQYKGSRPKTQIEITCTVRVAAPGLEVSGRTVKHRLRLAKDATLGHLRDRLAADTGVCGSNRMRLTLPGQGHAFRGFDEVPLADLGIKTTATATVLAKPEEDTEGEGGFEFDDQAAAEETVADAALTVAGVPGPAADAALAEGQAAAAPVDADAMPWPGGAAPEGGDDPTEYTSAAAVWGPLRGCGPAGAGVPADDERTGALSVLRLEPGHTGAVLTSLGAGGSAAATAWRLLRLVPWSSAMLASVERCSPEPAASDPALISRTDSALREAKDPSPGATAAGKGSSKKTGRRRRRAGPLSGAGSAWDGMLQGSRDALPALPGMLCVEWCVSQACLAVAGVLPHASPLIVPPKQGGRAASVGDEADDEADGKAAGAGSAADAMLLASASTGPASRGRAAGREVRVGAADGAAWLEAFAEAGGATHLLGLVACPADDADDPAAVTWAHAAARLTPSAASGQRRAAANASEDELLAPDAAAEPSAGLAAAAVALRVAACVAWACGRADGRATPSLRAAVDAVGGLVALSRGATRVLACVASACGSRRDAGAALGAAPPSFGEAELASAWEGPRAAAPADVPSPSPWGVASSAPAPGDGSPLASCVCWAAECVARCAATASMTSSEARAEVLCPLFGGAEAPLSASTALPSSPAALASACQHLLLRCADEPTRAAVGAGLLRVATAGSGPRSPASAPQLAALASALVEALPALARSRQQSAAYFALCPKAIKAAVRTGAVDAEALAAALARRLRKHRTPEASHADPDPVARGLLGLVYRVLDVADRARPPATLGSTAAAASSSAAAAAAAPAASPAPTPPAPRIASGSSTDGGALARSSSTGPQGLDREQGKLAAHLWHHGLFAVGGTPLSLPLLRTPQTREFALRLLRILVRRSPEVRAAVTAWASGLYGDDDVWGKPPPPPEPWASKPLTGASRERFSALQGARAAFASAWGPAPDDEATAAESRWAELLARTASPGATAAAAGAAPVAPTPAPPAAGLAGLSSAPEWGSAANPARVAPQARTAASVAPGLQNLGSTCYLNASLQQLFAVRGFRQGVLALDVGEDEDAARRARAETAGACSAAVGCDGGDADSMLFQLQSLFAHMHEHRGGGKAGTTRALCAAFRDWEGRPINPSVQQDATEFLAALFQQLDTRLAGSRHSRLMEAPFGLSLVCTLNADPAASSAAGAAETTSVRRQDATSLSVPVVSAPDRDEGLLAGLTATVAAEEVGYKWPVAGSDEAVEVRSLKRQLLGSAPPHLLLSLARFQFDMEVMQQRKRDDRVAFPLLLDTYSLTPNGQRRRRAAGAAAAEGAARPGVLAAAADAAGRLWQPDAASRAEAAAEDEDDAGDDDDAPGGWERLGDGAPLPAPASCVYLLSGVVVHRGTASAGHYWSLVRDRTAPVELRPASPEAAAAAVRRGAVGASALGLSDEAVEGTSGSWFKLDDRTVSPFSLDDMEEEAFGGEMTSSGRRRVVQQSAFLLVYDRVDPAVVARWARATSEALVEAAPFLDGAEEQGAAAEAAEEEAGGAPSKAGGAFPGLGSGGAAAAASGAGATAEDDADGPADEASPVLAATSSAASFGQGGGGAVSGVIVGLGDAAGTEPAPGEPSPRGDPSTSPMPRALFLRLRADRLRAQYLAQAASPAVLEFAMNLATSSNPPVPEGGAPDAWAPSPEQAVASAQLACRIALGVLPRLDDAARASLDQWAFVVERLCRQSRHAARWIVDRLASRPGRSTLRGALLECPHSDARAAAARIVIAALRGAGAGEAAPGAAWMPAPARWSEGAAGDGAAAADSAADDAASRLVRLAVVPLVALSAGRASSAEAVLRVLAAAASDRRGLLWRCGAVTALAAGLAGDGPIDTAAAADAEAASAAVSPKDREAAKPASDGFAACPEALEAAVRVLAKVLGSRAEAAAAGPEAAACVLAQSRAVLAPRPLAALVASASSSAVSRHARRAVSALCTPVPELCLASGGGPAGAAPSSSSSGPPDVAGTEHGRAVTAVVDVIAELCRVADDEALRGPLRVLAAVTGCIRQARYSSDEAVALAEWAWRAGPTVAAAEAADRGASMAGDEASRAADDFAEDAGRQWRGDGSGAGLSAAAARIGVPTPLSGPLLEACGMAGAGRGEDAAEAEAAWRVGTALARVCSVVRGCRRFRTATAVCIRGLCRLARRSGLVHRWLLTSSDGEAPGRPEVAAWWMPWLESTLLPRSLPAEIMLHKRSALERGGSGPSGADAGTRRGGGGGSSRKGGGGGRKGGRGGGAAAAAAAKTEQSLADAGPTVDVDVPGWVPGWAVESKEEAAVDWPGAKDDVLSVLASEALDRPAAVLALRSGAWGVGEAVVASDDDEAALTGTRVRLRRSGGKKGSAVEVVDAEVGQHDQRRGAAGSGGEFCLRTPGGTKTVWLPLQYSPFRFVAPARKLGKRAASGDA